MKRASLFLSLLFILSCGQSSNVTTQNNNENSNENKNETVGEIEVDLELLKSYMTFDILGGVFRRNIGSTSSILSESKGIITKSNPETPGTEAIPAESEKIEIDYSNQYLGFEGEGRLVISALGEGEESEGIRHIPSLKLRFLFFNYAFKNPCLGKLYLDGEIRCEVSGDYKIDKGEFLGQAHCMHGPEAEPIPILYITPQKFYEIELSANLTIDGSIYQYVSYRYSGKIKIDGEELNIEDIIQSAGSCS